MMIPKKEIMIAIMSMLDMASLKNKRDMTATAKGEQAMITVPIESGSTLNEYVISKKPMLPSTHLSVSGSHISRVIP